MKTFALCLALMGCASTSPDYRPSLSRIESRDFFVNTTPGIHYFVKASQAGGLQQLRHLAAGSLLEEAFYHVSDGANSIWFEVGEFEESNRATINGGIALDELGLFPAPSLEVALYHIHPRVTCQNYRERLERETNPQWIREIEDTFSEQFFCKPSSLDVVAHAIQRRFFSQYQQRIGKKVTFGPSYVVTSTGFFSVDVSPDVEDEIIDILRTSNLTGLIAAEAIVKRKLEVSQLEGIFDLIHEGIRKMESPEAPLSQNTTPLQNLKESLHNYAKVGIFIDYFPF